MSEFSFIGTHLYVPINENEDNEKTAKQEPLSYL